MLGHLAEKALHERDAPRPVLKPRNGASKVEKRQITRNRTSYSCQTCRRRKIKCDKQHPICGSCLKNNEECVYGKVDSELAEPPATTNGASALGNKRRLNPVHTDLGAAPTVGRAQGAELENVDLDSLEAQLHRLTTMLANIRRDSGTVARPQGPLTPMSGEAEWSNSQASSKSPEGNAHFEEHHILTQPLSELSLAKDAANEHAGFWMTIVEEVDQLHAMMQGIRPMGPPPHADAGFDMKIGCPGHSSAHLDQNQRSERNSGSESISFRKLAHEEHGDKPDDQCKICWENAGDKSVLIPGNSSTRLATLSKLDLLAGIPTEAQSNVLFRAWLTSVYPALPFMSIRHTFKKHAAFWDWKQGVGSGPDSTWDGVDVLFMPLLYSIWYTGTLSLSARGFKKWFPGKTRAQMAAHFHEQNIRYFSLVSFPSHIEAPLIGCLVLLQSVPAAEEEPVQSSTYFNLMIKLAQSIGVHREPALYGVAPHEAEIRRRMWWQILRLDLSFASSSGYPSYIGDAMHDTRSISDVYEAYIGTAEETKYLQNRADRAQQPDVLPEPLSDIEPLVLVFQLVARTTHTVVLAMRKAVNMHMSTKVISKEVLQSVNQTINDAEEQVRDTIRRIPTKGVPELGFTPDGNALSAWPLLECDESFGASMTDTEFSCYFGLPGRPNIQSRLSQYHRQKLSAFNKWARITLSAMCDQMYCVAYVPFLKNARSKVWTTGRQCALHHCSSFLRKLISLATDPGLESYRWHWPGTLHPMHAAMIVLVDVYARPHSTEAPRCRALIDKIFSLSDPEYGIVGGENGVSTQRPLREGGSDAWDLLRDLRRSGWRKAGLDDNVLWTEEDQIKVGIAKPLNAGEKMMQTLREDLLEPEDEANAFPQPHSVGTYPNLQYAMECYRKDIGGANSNGQANNMSELLTSDGQPNRQLFRLPTQQAMPYPLTGGERPRCPSMNYHHDTADKEAAESEARRHMEVKQQAAAHEKGIAAKPTFAPGPVKQNVRFPGYFNVDSTMVMTVNRTPAPTNGESGVNGVAQNLANGQIGAQNGDSRMKDVEESFDWERWDAVFGQYSGFTDLMEMDTSEWDGAAPHT